MPISPSSIDMVSSESKCYIRITPVARSISIWDFTYDSSTGTNRPTKQTNILPNSITVNNRDILDELDTKMNANGVLSLIYPVGCVFRGLTPPSIGTWRKIGYYGRYEATAKVDSSNSYYF